MKPAKNEYFPYFEHYISLVPNDDVIHALSDAQRDSLDTLEKIEDRDWSKTYAPGKWTVKELWQHVTDTERIFSYRALCFARMESQILPAFDENAYALHSGVSNRHPDLIVSEYKAVRIATLALFTGLNAEEFSRTGTVPAGRVSVNALAFAICGHNLHHLGVLRERYLK
ncbi:MAG TPA: DinB family protein [Bacteroidia bacterium]|nr:DinB family protein [Bacteroidia bacterium]